MDRIHGRQAARRQGMPHLMKRHHSAFIGAQHAAFAFNPGDDAFYGSREVVQADGISPATCRHDGGFIDQVGQVRAGKPRGDVGNALVIEVWRDRYFLQMDLEYCLTTFSVWAIDQHLAVDWSRPAIQRPHEGRIHPVRTVTD